MLRIVIPALLVMASTGYSLNLDECRSVVRGQECRIYLTTDDPDRVSVSLLHNSKERLLFTLDRATGYAYQQIKFTEVQNTVNVTLIGRGDRFYQKDDIVIMAGTELWEQDRRSIYSITEPTTESEAPSYYTYPEFSQDYED